MCREACNLTRGDGWSAYLRRKNGERGLSFADLHRETVEDWVARRRRTAANPG